MSALLWLINFELLFGFNQSVCEMPNQSLVLFFVLGYAWVSGVKK